MLLFLIIFELILLILRVTDTEKLLHKLYKIYTKVIKNIKFVHILYTKILQINILCDNEYKKMYIKFLHIYKKCTKSTKHVNSSD